MTTRLLEINPLELKFTFEVKKQSSCAIQLANVSDQYVAFKVKTTSPKKYCVRPNIGVIKPKSTCDFTVTMQAQRSAPADMDCKDKFLVQSIVVAFGSNEDDIIPSMFAKDGGFHIEEKKLRVVLIRPPHSPVLLPLNGYSEKEPDYETKIEKDKFLSGVENLPPPQSQPNKGSADSRSLTHVEEPIPVKVVEKKALNPVKSVAFNPVMEMERSIVKDVEGKGLMLTKEIAGLKAKLNAVGSKLNEAEFTISKLKEEGCTTTLVNEKLKQELAVLRRTSEGRTEVGFPLQFVCMVALISMAVGYVLLP